MTGATTGCADTDLATSGFARRSAPIACDQRTTGSLSPSSSVSHATGSPRGLGLVPGRQKRGLPEARRAGDESEPAVRSASKTFQKALARDRLLAHRRRPQLRAHQVGCIDTLCPPPSATESCRSEVSWRASGST